MLLHGFATSGFLWRNVAPALPLGRVTAFAADMFGWGESDRALDADYGASVLGRLPRPRAHRVLRVARADIVAVDVGCVLRCALAARAAAGPGTLDGVDQLPGDPSAALRGSDFALLKRLAARHLLDAARGMLGAATLLSTDTGAESVARAEAMPRALVGRYAAPFVWARLACAI